MWKRNLINKFQTSFAQQSNFDGLIISDPVNLTMITGIRMMFLQTMKNYCVYVLWSHERKVLICPKSLSSSFSNEGWNDNIIVYESCLDPIQKATDILIEEIRYFFRAGSNLGFEGTYLSQKVFDRLTEALPSVHFSDSVNFITDLRQIKNETELNNLKQAAEIVDHGIAGAIHHIATIQSKTEKFLTEDIRVHSLERGLHINGYNAVSQAISGDKSKKLWANPPKFGIGNETEYREGELLRLEMCGMVNNYWANDARTLLKGKLNNVQDEFFAKIADLRSFACSIIRPGIAANDIYTSILNKANELGLDMIKEFGFGHGIGLEPVESPYISASDPTVLAENMSVVLQLSARYIHGEIITSKDTIFITPEGCEIIGWYENWNAPYTTAYTF
jgi:Xaa-Pro aminopeptidase